MARKPIAPQTLEHILVASRRRCCLCFGLEGDLGIKQGQIAHLDRDHANNHLDNLAFLCLKHHDQYDSRTSQSKGLTVQEVRRFRSDLERRFLVADPGTAYALAAFEALGPDPDPQLAPPIVTTFVETGAREIRAEIPILNWTVSDEGIVPQVLGWQRITHDDTLDLGPYEPARFIESLDGLCFHKLGVSALADQVSVSSWIQVRPCYMMRGELAVCPSLQRRVTHEGLYCLCDPLHQLLWRRVSATVDGFMLLGHQVEDCEVVWADAANYRVIARVVKSLHPL